MPLWAPSALDQPASHLAPCVEGLRLEDDDFEDDDFDEDEDEEDDEDDEEEEGTWHVDGADQRR